MVFSSYNPVFEADDEWSLDISEKCMSEKNTYVTRLENIKNCEKIVKD